MIGVQRDLDRVLRRDDVGEFGESDGAGDHLLDRRAGGELGAAGGDLQDPVAAGLGEPAQAALTVSDDVTLIAG